VAEFCWRLYRRGHIEAGIEPEGCGLRRIAADDAARAVNEHDGSLRIWCSATMKPTIPSAAKSNVSAFARREVVS